MRPLQVQRHSNRLIPRGLIQQLCCHPCVNTTRFILACRILRTIQIDMNSKNAVLSVRDSIFSSRLRNWKQHARRLYRRMQQARRSP